MSGDISEENISFWDDLCGSYLARSIGITDKYQSSLKKYDDWYFNFYPYLFKYIPFDELRGKDVLEIGLGYGTVSQKIAESGARYTGMDIAKGPVDMVNHRLRQSDLSGMAYQKSILSEQFQESQFDFVIAIGCLHHTGDLELAIENCRKLLRPGGKLIFMVYNAYSYRRFRVAFLQTLWLYLKEINGYRGVVGKSSPAERAAYDTDVRGLGAPYTDWISEKSLKKYCCKFTKFSSTIENIAREIPFIHLPREKLLTTRWPAVVGLDVYVTVVK